MYRAERAAMGIPGGHDADLDKAPSADKYTCATCNREFSGQSEVRWGPNRRFCSFPCARKGVRGEVHCDRCDLPKHPPGHDAPFRVLLDSEVAKLKALCEERRYLYWWDMGSMVLTLEKAREPATDYAPAAALRITRAEAKVEKLTKALASALTLADRFVPEKGKARNHLADLDAIYTEVAAEVKP